MHLAARHVLTDRDDLLRLAEHPRRERQRVGAQVEQRAAGEVVAQDAVGVGEPLAVVREHGPYVAEHAVVEQLPDHVVARQVERPQRLCAVHAALGRPRGDVRCLRRVQRDRLLHQHVLAGEVGVRAVGAVRELLRRRDRARPDGDDLLAGVAAQRTGEPLGDPAGAEHAPAQRGRGHGVGQPGRRHRGREGHRSPSLRSVGNALRRCDIDSLASSLIAARPSPRGRRRASRR
jgi:hypothetical protein